jgi:hypothetical protein
MFGHHTCFNRSFFLSSASQTPQMDSQKQTERRLLERNPYAHYGTPQEVSAA